MKEQMARMSLQSKTNSSMNNSMSNFSNSNKSTSSNWYCHNNHQLSSVTGKNHHICNICRYTIGSNPSLRCQSCDFDICNQCSSTKSPSLVNKLYGGHLQPQKCLNHHDMKPRQR